MGGLTAMPPLPAAGVVEGGLAYWRPLQPPAAAPAALCLKQLRGLAGDGLGHHGKRSASRTTALLVAFFSSGVADNALRLGPYMRRSRLK